MPAGVLAVAVAMQVGERVVAEVVVDAEGVVGVGDVEDAEGAAEVVEVVVGAAVVEDVVVEVSFNTHFVDSCIIQVNNLFNL